MVAPAILLGAAALGAGANYMGQKEGAAAAARASDRAMAQENALRAQALNTIKYGIDPSELSALYDIGGYNPEMLGYIDTAQPISYQDVGGYDPTMVQDSPEARAIQMDALSKLEQRAEEGLSAEDKAQFMLGQMRTGETARGREEAIIQSLQERGMGGSGIESSLRQQANQDAINQLAMQQSMQAEAAANQRAEATGQAFGMAGQLRSQDIGLSQTNADILNQMGLENSRRRQEIMNMNIANQNQAAQDTVNQQRALQASNVSSRNQAQMIEQERQRQNLMDIYGAKADRAQLEAGSLLGGVEGIRAQGAANAQADAARWQALGQLPSSMMGSYMNYSAMDRYGNQPQAQMQQSPSQSQQLSPQPMTYNYQPNKGSYYG